MIYMCTKIIFLNKNVFFKPNSSISFSAKHIVSWCTFSHNPSNFFSLVVLLLSIFLHVIRQVTSLLCVFHAEALNRWLNIFLLPKKLIYYLFVIPNWKNDNNCLGWGGEGWYVTPSHPNGLSWCMVVHITRGFLLVPI